MNNFNRASQEERLIMTKFFKQKNITNYTFTEIESFDRYDAIINNKAVIEVKVRNQNSTDFSSTMIEKSKFDFLINYSKETNLIPFLFVYYKKDKLLRWWNLLEQPRKIIILKCPKSTMGDNTMIDKECIDIQVTKALGETIII